LPNNNIINQNNNYYINNNVSFNNPYMEYNYPMNYNKNIPLIQNNNINNYYLNYNNNFNGDYYHPNNILNVNNNNFQNNINQYMINQNMMNQNNINQNNINQNMINQNMINQNMINQNNIIYSDNNINIRNNIDNQNNLNNNNIKNELEKHDIFKILKRAQFKLSGFRLSKLKSENKNEETIHCGCPYYMAPELLLMETPLEAVESQKIDIWALGVIAFEMFFGRKPFEAQSLEELSRKYKNGEYYLNLNMPNIKISKEFVEFLNLCLQNLPKKRVSVYELQLTDFYNMSYKSIIILNENEIYKSLGFPEKNENNILILRTDKNYYEQSIEDYEEDEE